MSRHEVITSADPTAAALEIVTEAMRRAVSERGRFLVALSGGRTPLELYRRLARKQDLPWSRTHVYWGDERFVPHDHPDSNAGAARSVLLGAVPLAPEHVHPWPILDTPQESAEAYAATLVRTAGNPPSLDLALLGLGADCHTASLFPGTGAHRANGVAVASRPAATEGPRLSLTATALSRTRTIVFLVTGDDKRDALARLLSEDGDGDRCPARSIDAAERLVVVTDLEIGRPATP